jgi:hypothetical protein
MAWKWPWKSRRRKTHAARSTKTSFFLDVERLEDRLQPAAVLDSLMPSFESGTFPLYSGGSVGPLTTSQTSGQVQPVHETGSGALDDQTSYSYSFDVTGGVGNDGIATYEETYTYTFETTINDWDGTSTHESGTYQYLYIVTTSANETTFSLITYLSFHQTGSKNGESTDAAGSTTTITSNWDLDHLLHREIHNNTDLGTGVSAGSDVSTGSGTQSYSASGTHSYPDGGWGATVTTDFTEDGDASTDYTITLSVNKAAEGNWSFTGNASANSVGESHSTYAGGGTYSSNEGTSSASGTILLNGADNKSYAYSASYLLGADGSWQFTNATGGGVRDGFETTSYATSGAYSSFIVDESVDGSFTQNGQLNTDYSYTFSAAAASSGAWSFTGSGTANSVGEDHSTYTGTGTYSGSDGASSSSGSVIEGGAINSDFHYTTSYVLGSDGIWQVAGGTGSGGGSGFSNSSYNGNGNYSQDDSTGALSGTYTENGQADSDYTYTFSASRNTDGTWSFAGSGTGSLLGEDHFSYAGSGNQ